jgi:galactoside O-acetyltransferase
LSIKSAIKYFKNKIMYTVFYYQWVRSIKFKILSNAKMYGYKPKLIQPVLFRGLGEINIGKNVYIGIAGNPYYFSTYGYIEVRNSTSKVRIGNNVGINNNFSIICNRTNIEIGNNCSIGANVTIIDSDFHSLNPAKRLKNIEGENKSVIIGDNVFIGNNVSINKGVKIGSNSVIGAKSVVLKEIPPNVIAGGVPCDIIKKIDK